MKIKKKKPASAGFLKKIKYFLGNQDFAIAKRSCESTRINFLIFCFALTFATNNARNASSFDGERTVLASLQCYTKCSVI